MVVFQLNPVDDSRWLRFVNRHPHASVFHTPEWLQALSLTYGYEPIALTTSAPGDELKNGIVLCRIKSWLTGQRLVSVPFADHCQPLVDDSTELAALITSVRRQFGSASIELRPLSLELKQDCGKLCEFRMHRIDLQSGADALFKCFHKNIQRNIRRAESRGLTFEAGASSKLLNDFRQLHALTRKRHHLPSQPELWFRNLIDNLGSRLAIRVAYKSGHPVAAILTLRHNHVMVYKYGGHDLAFKQYGGMSWLLWQSIQEACAAGFREFDLGRSDLGDSGLIRFKDSWASASSTLTYWNAGAQRESGRTSHWIAQHVRPAVSYLPDSLVASVGGVLYRHFG